MAGQMASEDDDEVLYCVCKAPYDGIRFMIECDACEDWFHGSCVDVTESEAANIEIYHCPTCALVYGESISKKKKKRGRKSEPTGTRSSSRSKASDPKIGSKAFIELLVQKEFSNADCILVRLANGKHFTVSYLEDHGFAQPVIIESPEGLGMKLPSPSFSVTDVEKLVGSKMEIDVIDVEKQQDFKLTVQDWVKYYCKPVRPKVLNVISLEFSSTPMASVVKPPQIVGQIGWVQNCWPESETEHEKPLVQSYCLMGVKGGYTDFHVDFGGTSVWYHVLKGEKVFYLIEPTQENLILYEKWLSPSNQSNQFLGDVVDVCYQYSIRPGNTLFIPAGWIHAVYTPVDSLVFGGNFLHHFSIDTQIKVFELEKRCQTPLRYMFPNFETVHWYAAKKVHDDLRDFIDNNEDPPEFLLYGAKQLCHALQSWSRRKGYIDEKAIPSCIQHNKLLRELQQQVKALTVHKGRVVQSPSKPRSPKKQEGMVIEPDKPTRKSPVKRNISFQDEKPVHEKSNVQGPSIQGIAVQGISFDVGRGGPVIESSQEYTETSIFDLPHLIDHNYACEEGKEKPQLPMYDEAMTTGHGRLSTSEEEVLAIDTELDSSAAHEAIPQNISQALQQKPARTRTRSRTLKPAQKDKEFFYPGIEGSDSEDEVQKRERKPTAERVPRGSKKPPTTVKQRLGKLLKL